MMPFNCLLWYCLQHGTTAEAGGASAILNRKTDRKEYVLLFKTDKHEYKKAYAHDMKVSDFLYYFTDLDKQFEYDTGHRLSSSVIHLIFVELGGSKADHCISQLEATVSTIHRHLRDANRLRNTKLHALIVYTAGSAPKNLDDAKRRFSVKYQTILKAKWKRADVRQEFSI